MDILPLIILFNINYSFPSFLQKINKSVSLLFLKRFFEGVGFILRDCSLPTVAGNDLISLFAVLKNRNR